MKADEDEDDETTIASGRYPCLPSLVALQQMRNRLHMAHNGKRLMKWSAMATGRELRKLAHEVDQVFRGFEQDMKDAFILLARCRYYYPNLNVMTTENVGNRAAVSVDYSTKCVTGVRILQYEIIESGVEPLPCLGIDRGGKCIREAKIAWLELLKRLIRILQLRTSFTLLDLSNKGSTKKANVLGKIVIPKTETTIRYILSQLEEMEREEFFRLKKVLEVKYRHKKKKQQNAKAECPLCKAEKEAAARKKEAIKAKKCIICKGPMQADPNKASKDEAKRLDIQEQLDKIISLTNEYDKKGIRSAAVDDFKVMAEQLRQKLMSKEFAPIPKDVDVSKLCSACKQRLKTQTPSITFSLDKPDGAAMNKICDKGSAGGGSGASATSHVSGHRSPQSEYRSPSPVPYKPSPVSLSQTPNKPSPVSLSQPSKTPSEVSQKKPKLKDAVCERHADLELGTFETDVKEIVKIVRKRNADGTLTEEKMVITIKKETRNPQGGDEEVTTSTSRVDEGASTSSSKHDHPYDSKRTIGVITIPNTKKRPTDIAREVNSYYSQFSPSPSERASVVSIDSELEAWMEATKTSIDNASSNEVLPKFDESKIGVAATVNTKLAVIPREVQSYDSPAISTTNHPVVRNCKSSSSMICMNNFIDRIDEENEMKANKCSTSFYSDTEEDNDKSFAPRKESLVVKKGLKSHNLPPSIAKSMNLDKPCIPASNTTAIATKTDISTGKLGNLEWKNFIPLLTDFKEKTIEKDPISNIQIKINGTTEEIKREDTPIIETPSEMKNHIILENNINKVEKFNLCKLTTCKHFTERNKIKHNKLLKNKKNNIDESFPEIVQKEIDYLPPEYYYEETKEPQLQPQFHHNIVSKMKSARSNLEIGVFETSMQEVVQIVRQRNKDGTLTEERKVLQIKREIRYPAENYQNDNFADTINEKIYVNSSRASIASKRYVDSKTVGMVSTYDHEKWRAIGREVKSYYAPISSLKDELPRYCVSSTSMITVDHEFEAVCKCLISNSDQKENIASDLREYVTSSTEFEKIIDSFVPNEYTEEASTSGNSNKCVCRSASNSEQNIDLDSIQEKQRTIE